MKYVHKNQNHRGLCFYAMNNHMHLVKNPDLRQKRPKSPNIKLKHLYQSSMMKFKKTIKMIMTITDMSI